jgi:PPOX class probable F420-dependent enzyme
MSSSKLHQFEGQKYLNLQTLRKNGTSVDTPVWFAQDGEVFYVYSLANAGKVKRIRNNPRVKVIPCDMRGNTEGEWVDANARIVDEPEAERAHKLLNKKYGLIKRIGGFYSKLLNRERTTIAIEFS